jgi:hypothetical protein
VTPPADRTVLVDTWHRRFDGSVLFDQVGITDGERGLVLERTKNAWSLLDLGEPDRAPAEVAAGFDPTPWIERVRAYVEAPPIAVTGAAE